MTNEKTKQALQIIKQTIDESIKAGVLKNLEQTQIVSNAFMYLTQILDNDRTDSNINNSNS